MRNMVRFQAGNCSSWKPQRTPTCVVVNPPWGSRLLSEQPEAALGGLQDALADEGSGVGTELLQAWHDLRDFFKVQQLHYVWPEVW